MDLDRAPHGWLLFKGESQKTGYEQWVPLTIAVRDLMVAHLRELAPEKDACLFPAVSDVSTPVDRSVMSRKLRQAYERAGLATPKGGLWHAWRRKWATERKNMPLKDVAAAGGWRDVRTLLKCYQQPDEGTLTDVVLRAPKLYQDGAEPAKVTPIPTPLNLRKKSALG